MARQECLCSCETPLVREIRILGTPVRVKGYICAGEDGIYRPKPEQVLLQLTLCVTRLCDARCPFCIAAPATDPSALDPDRLYPLLEALREEGVVRGVSITGGEPCADMERLDRIIRAVFDVFGPGMQVTLDTNGAAARRLPELRDLHRLDTVHISRHHWEDAENNRVFGREMPAGDELGAVIRGIGIPGLFVLNCMMLKGLVDSPEAAHRYLDFAIETGAGKTSFITATPVNSWTRENRVLFDEVLRDGDPALLFTRGFRDYSWCRCRDGVYLSPEGRLMEFYGRHSEPGDCGYCRGLVIDPEGNLRTGFNGKILGERSQGN